MDRFALVALTAALAATGCGDGGSDGPANEASGGSGGSAGAAAGGTAGSDTAGGASGGGASSGGAGGAETSGGASAGGSAAGGASGGSGGSGAASPSNDMVVFSDQIGLYTIIDGVTTELGTGPDYQVLNNLVLSPDSVNLLHAVGRDTRVTALADGVFVVDRQVGFLPGTWMDAATALVAMPGSTSPSQYQIASMDLSGATTSLLDLGTREYCTPGPNALSPDGGKVVMRCGYGNNVEIVVGDIATMEAVSHGPTQLTGPGTPPIWVANDYIAYTASGEVLAFDTPAFDSVVTTTAKASAILVAGPDAVLAIGTEVGSGGLNINTYKKVSIPSGDVVDMTWLADINPPFAKVSFSHDGSRVLFAEGKNGIAYANVDGSGKVVVKESDTGALAPSIQSLTW